MGNIVEMLHSGRNLFTYLVKNLGEIKIKQETSHCEDDCVGFFLYRGSAFSY